MSDKGDGRESLNDKIPRHLSNARYHLLVAILHLAAIEDELADEKLLRSRRLIARTLDWVGHAHDKVAK